jgi:acylglycerol lipase
MASVEVLAPVATDASLPTVGVEPQPPLGIPEPDKPSKEEVRAGGVPITVYDETDPEVYLGPRGREATMVNKQGLALKAYFWPAEKPIATLILCHGHGAHLQFELLNYGKPGQAQEYAGSWAQRMNEAGISVCGIDNQGCGRSEGLYDLRFYVDSFDDYVDDCLQLAESIVAAERNTLGSNTDASEVYEDCNRGNEDVIDKGNTKGALAVPPGFMHLPTYISGISLGGCIAYCAALRRPELFSGTLLLAPMLSLEKASRQGLNPYLKPLATVLSRLFPTAAIVATDRNVLNPDIQTLWDADPLCSHGKTRVRNASEYLRITETVMASLDQFELPFFVAHSEFDTMTDCDGSKALYLRGKSQDKTLRLVNQMWHVLMKEEGNEILCEEICEWIRSRAGA